MTEQNIQKLGMQSAKKIEKKWGDEGREALNILSSGLQQLGFYGPLSLIERCRLYIVQN